MFSSKPKLDLSPRLKSAVGRPFFQRNFLKIGSILFLFFAILLSFNALRLILSSKNQTTQSLNPEQAVLGATDYKTAENSSEVSYIEYKIQKGDTLFFVSQKFNINWSTLAAINNLKSPFSLKPGQIIKIPK